MLNDFQNDSWIYYSTQECRFISILSAIENSNKELHPTELFYVKEAPEFFDKIKTELMGCLYPRKIEYNFPLINESMQIFDAILPIQNREQDRKSRKEMIERVRKTTKIKNQLEKLVANQKEFYENEDKRELLEICGKIKDIYCDLTWNETERSLNKDD